MSGIIVYAKQRTGTNFLRSILANTTKAKDLGEIFHTETLSDPENFFSYFSSCGLTLPVIRDEDYCVSVVREYFENISGKYNRFIADIKYNSSFAITPTWFSPVECPIMIRYILKSGYRLIHVTRRDRIAHAVSQLFAEHSGQYHSRPGTEYIEPLSFGKIRLDPLMVRQMIDSYNLEIEYARRYLSNYSNVAEVEYEEISGATSIQKFEIVQRLVGPNTAISAEDFVDAETRRVLPDWREVVENVSEIEGCFLT